MGSSIWSGRPRRDVAADLATAAPADAIVTFRDANEPRALAGRLVASAHRHSDGWSLCIPDMEGRTGHATVDDAVAAVSRATGIRHVLMVWTVVGTD